MINGILKEIYVVVTHTHTHTHTYIYIYIYYPFGYSSSTPNFPLYHIRPPQTTENIQYSFSYKFLTIKPTRCTNFSNLFLEWNSTCFGQFCPSSRVFYCTHSNGICHTGLLTAASRIRMELRSILILLATCMTYTIAVCIVKNSWWWTEELSETCRVSFQK